MTSGPQRVRRLFVFATLVLSSLSACENPEGAISGITSDQCESQPSICTDKCPTPPILIEVTDASTKKGIEGVKIKPPFTLDGEPLKTEQFGGVCKITEDKTRTLCRINEKPNYLGLKNHGLFSFRVEAPDHKGATLKAQVPPRLNDCCCPFIPATDILELPPL